MKRIKMSNFARHPDDSETPRDRPPASPSVRQNLRRGARRERHPRNSGGDDAGVFLDAARLHALLHHQLHVYDV